MALLARGVDVHQWAIMEKRTGACSSFSAASLQKDSWRTARNFKSLFYKETKATTPTRAATKASGAVRKEWASPPLTGALALGGLDAVGMLEAVGAVELLLVGAAVDVGTLAEGEEDVGADEVGALPELGAAAVGALPELGAAAVGAATGTNVG